MRSAESIEGATMTEFSIEDDTEFAIAKAIALPSIFPHWCLKPALGVSGGSTGELFMGVLVEFEATVFVIDFAGALFL